MQPEDFCRFPCGLEPLLSAANAGHHVPVSEERRPAELACPAGHPPRGLHAVPEAGGGLAQWSHR